MDIDFDQIEDELELVVPDVYKQFIEHVDANNFDLVKYGIYSNTKTLLEGNWRLRFALEDQNPAWEDNYLDFGVNDGCGNYFFLVADAEDDDVVCLWAHDPPGIEDVSSGTEFFQKLGFEIANDFTGPGKNLYSGNGPYQ